MGVDTKWLAKQQETRMSDTTVTITSETFEYMADRIEELEAKLEKAVDFIEDLTGCEWPYDEEAKRILAELTGGKDE